MDLEKRMEELEKTVQRQRRNQFILIGCLAVVLIAWAIWPKPRTVVAEQFILKDPSGQVRSMWGITKDGPSFLMQDEFEQRFLTLGFGGEEDLGLIVADSKKKTRFFAGTLRKKSTEKVTSGVFLTDDDGKTRLNLTVEKRKPSLWMGGGDDKRSVLLNINKKGSGLYVNDATGWSRFAAGIAFKESTGEVAPGVHLRDDKGNPRAVFQYQLNEPFLVFLDSEKRRRAGLAVGPDGMPGIWFVDEKDQVIWSEPPHDK